MGSISEVAALAGVSATTVSHAISGKRKVSDSVMSKVQLAMQQLNYVPSRSAQNLASGRTRIIGLIVPDIRNSFFADLTFSVENELSNYGYNVILCTTGFDHAREVDHLAMIRSRAVDGLIYAAGAPPSNSQLGAILGDLPLVLVDEYVPETRATSFASDNYAGGRIAAEHLASLAHQRAVVLAAGGQLVSSDERVAGFRDAWVEMGFGAPTVVSGPFTEAGGREAMRRALPQIGNRASSAVFAVNDLMALGAIEVLRENDLSVPEDVSVVGFDDIPAARYAVPQLTTVRQDVDKLGRLAVAALVKILERSESSDAPPPQRKELPVSLIVRQSTAIARTEGS